MINAKTEEDGSPFLKHLPLKEQTQDSLFPVLEVPSGMHSIFREM